MANEYPPNEIVVPDDDDDDDEEPRVLIVQLGDNREGVHVGQAATAMETLAALMSGECPCQLCQLRREVADVASADPKPNSFALWASAWRTGMALLGLPKAYIAHEFMMDGSVQYTWGSDMDRLCEAFAADEHYDMPQEEWDTAHTVLVMVDALRPTYVTPSPMLKQLLDEEKETIDGEDVDSASHGGDDVQLPG